MPRNVNRLTATGIAAIRSKGRYADGAGLYLRVSPELNKSWVFRWVRNGSEREMGLGAYPLVSLASARKAAFQARTMLAEGLDPKNERDREREAFRTFGAVSKEYLAEMGGRWTNEKTRWQWQHTLTVFTKSIQSRSITSIETADVLRLLKPIWQAKPETASKARMRLEAVLDYAKSKGWREGENPARWRGHLSNILPARQKLTKGHHPAMPYEKVPEFWSQLAELDAVSAKALQFLILTAGRTGEVLKATWDEIDLESRLWTIPASRMKARRDHRVPLTDTAVSILRPLYEYRVSQFVFPGQKPNKPLSNMALEMLMKRMRIDGASPHGFRSSFRDWAGDQTSFPREVAEAALAHRVGNEVELAYRRGDALNKRRELMLRWMEFLLCKPSEKVVKVQFAQ